MSGPQVYFRLPTTLSPTPLDLPKTLPPPVKERTFRSPFGIEPWLFNGALRPEIPILFATAYIIIVFSLNAYNKSRDHKPWWIARQRPFQWFVVVHNVLLAAYSFATFYAMLQAIANTWPGWNPPNGPAEWADALCKINGPRGLGDATTFNTTINIWEAKNSLIHLGYDGNPDPTDVGRLWNEGLAFWGWIFYVSKFYEVIDTLIILAKGKRSATLQTYHHAGAMLCMWAGIRYMSPPIWMFVFINSFIHAMMYTYFAFSALGYRVPQGLKRTLTSMQIFQFVFGASYAALHLFVQYDIPVSTPYEVATTVQRAVSSVSSAASAATSAVSQVVESPIASATLGALLKKLLLRAAGEEGVAERVQNDRGELTTPHIAEKIQYFNEQTFETRWRHDWTRVNCIDTTGEAFAIYLNLLYLLPLTVLFARFFIRAYTQRGKPRNPSQAAKQTSSSARDAKRRTESAIEDRGEKLEDELAQLAPDAADRVRKAEDRLAELGSEGTEKVRKETGDLQDQLRADLRKMKEGKLKSDRRVSDRVASFERQVKTVAQKAKEQGQEFVNGGSNSPRRGGSPSKSQHEDSKDENTIDDEPEQQTKSEEAAPAEEPKQSEQSKKEVDDEKPEGQADVKPEPSAEGKDQQQKKPAKEGPKEEVKPTEKPQGSPKKNGKKNKSKKDTGADDESSASKDNKPSPSQESEKKQDENMAKSQATRPGTADEDVASTQNDKESQPSQSDGANDESATTESEEKQDKNMAESQATRPGTDDPSASVSDMGKSGVMVDHPDESSV